MSDDSKMKESANNNSSKRFRFKISKMHIQGFIAGILVTAIATLGSFIAINPSLLSGSAVEQSDPAFYKAFPDAFSESLSFSNDEYTVGELSLFPFDLGLQDFIHCRGNLLSANTNIDLYSMIGNSYGGSFSYFQVPDYSNQLPFNGFNYYIKLEGPKPVKGNVQSITVSSIRYYESSEMDMYLGEIILAKNADNYSKLLPCDGRSLEISRYTALNTLIGNRFGGNKNNFNIPDMSKVKTPIDGAKYYIAVAGIYPAHYQYNNPTPPPPAPTPAIPTIYRAFPKGVQGNLENPDYVCIGELLLTPYDFEVVNTKKCQKDIKYQVKGNEALFSVIGNRFGGNGDWFGIPDLTGQSPLTGLNYYISASGTYSVFRNLSEEIPAGEVSYLPERNRQDLFWDFYTGQIILAKNIDDEDLISAVPCDGRELSSNSNMALYSLIGNKFGGNSDKFKIPDLSKASPIDGAKYYIVTNGLYPTSNN